MQPDRVLLATVLRSQNAVEVEAGSLHVLKPDLHFVPVSALFRNANNLEDNG